MAFWLSLQLPPKIQQDIFRLRTLASPLETHTPTLRRSADNPYEESMCPLCARIPPARDSDYCPESFLHFVMECPHLNREQGRLHAAAARFCETHGSLRLKPKAQPTPWSLLPDTQKIGLLLGNETTALRYSRTTRAARKDWLKAFLQTVAPFLEDMFDRRETLIFQHYPELDV